MTELREALDDYLALRRSLGYKLERAGELLDDFVGWMERANERRVTVGLALDWALLSADSGSNWRAQRLGVVRGFARFLLAFDPGTEVPPAGLLPPGRSRPAPFLYADQDIAALMAAARGFSSPLRSATLETMIGLYSTTGLRVGEALRLERRDVDLELGVLNVENSKGGKSRSVPLHASTTEALGIYWERRCELLHDTRSTSFFVSTKGTRWRAGNLGAAFGEALHRAGLPPRTRNGGPRLGDFRHTFAVRTILGWYQAGADIEVQLPLLSTYMGHVSPVSTYWYLSASPELLAAAATRMDSTLGRLP